MAKEHNDLIDRLVYVLFRTVSAALHSFPINTQLKLAGPVSALMFRFDRKHRERAMGNLRKAYPDMPEPQRIAIAKESMAELIMFFIEVLYTHKIVRIDTWTRYIELENFRDSLALLLKRNQGVVMLTAHYGNFEILGYLLATLGFPTASVARPLDNKYVSDYIFGVREKLGQRMIIKKGATEEVTEELDRHGAVGFVADQNAGSKGIFVDFFGRRAATYKSIGLVAMTYNVPVVVGYARRIGRQFKFTVGVQDVIYPDDWKAQDDPLRYITQRYTSAIEAFVREEPGQYWWVHRRWKTRPKGEAPETFD
ncbi:lysophospholipid acyltransferase family protein [soil metagenome]